MSFYEVANKIDLLISKEPSPNEMRDLLYIIRSDVSYLHYFFERVSDIYWFVALREAGYFNADNNPKPSPADQEGLYSIPQWNVLPYLERVSQQVSKPGSEKYIADLLAIIKDVSTYKNAIGQHIDNYRTWYYFAKILANLPTEKITKEIIDLIPTWLDTKFSSSLPGREITEKLLPKFLNSENSKDWEKAERLIEIITEIKWVPLSEHKGISIRETSKRAQ